MKFEYTYYYYCIIDCGTGVALKNILHLECILCKYLRDLRILSLANIIEFTITNSYFQLLYAINLDKRVILIL